MKKIYSYLFCFLGFTFTMQAQTTLTVDPATEYQTIVGLGGGNGAESDPDFIKYIVDYLGITQYRQWLQTKPDVTVDQINNGPLTFSIFTPSTINYLKSLASKGVVLLGTPLTPPACLKKNNCLTQRAPAVIGGPLICGQACVPPVCSYNYPDPDNHLLPEYYDEYARYLALYCMEFKKQIGTGIYALSIQNEPLFNEPYGSALLYSYEYGKVLKMVHDTFAKYPEIADIKFFGPEHMCGYARNTGGDGNGSKYIQSLLDSATYKPYLDAFAVHGYDNGITPDLGSAATWAAFANKVITEHKKSLWMTETEGTFDEWADAYWYIKGLFMSFKSGQVSVYSYNSLQRFYSSGSARRQLFNHMHFYRFIRPGAKMIKVADSDTEVEAIGFKNGTDYSLVVINLSKNPKTVSFSDFTGKPAFFHVYRSTAMDMCAYVGKVTNNTFDLPGESVVTVTYNAANPNASYGPLAPTNLATTLVSDNAINVSWTPASPWVLDGTNVSIAGYMVYINGVKKTVDGPTTKNTWSFTGLKPGTKYIIEIYTRDSPPMRNQSVAAKIEVTTTCSAGNCVPDTTSSIDKLEVPMFRVWPNPAQNYVTLNILDDQAYSLVMYDINGKMVLSESVVTNQSQINVSSLASGIYFINISNKEKNYRTKIAIE